MAPIAANKGGRLEAKVVNVGDDTFTIHVTGKGHEHHEKDIVLPLEDYNGAGAATGAKHRASEDNPTGYEPKCRENGELVPPKPGEMVLFDADAHAEAAAAAN